MSGKKPQFGDRISGLRHLPAVFRPTVYNSNKSNNHFNNSIISIALTVFKDFKDFKDFNPFSPIPVSFNSEIGNRKSPIRNPFRTPRSELRTLITEEFPQNVRPRNFEHGNFNFELRVAVFPSVATPNGSPVFFRPLNHQQSTINFSSKHQMLPWRGPRTSEIRNISHACQSTQNQGVSRPMRNRVVMVLLAVGFLLGR